MKNRLFDENDDKLQLRTYLEDLFGATGDDVFFCALVSRVFVIVDSGRLLDAQSLQVQRSDLVRKLGTWRLVLTSQHDLEREIERTFSACDRAQISEQRCAEFIGEGLFSGKDFESVGAEKIAEVFDLQKAAAAQIIQTTREWKSGFDEAQ